MINSILEFVISLLDYESPTRNERTSERAKDEHEEGKLCNTVGVGARGFISTEQLTAK